MLCDVVNERKKALGLTNAMISKQTGITLSTLDKITSGANQNPTLDTMEKLADVLCCTLDDFSGIRSLSADAKGLANDYDTLDLHGKRAVRAVLDVELERLQQSLEPEPAPEMVILRRYDIPAAAGAPLYAESEYENIAYPAEIVPSGTDYAVGILGDSMTPEIPDGCTVFVQRAENASVQNRDIVIAWIAGDGSVCKRVIMKGGRVVKLESANRACPDIEGDALEGMRVYGKVLGCTY